MIRVLVIVKLVKDFSEARGLDEYGDYQEHPTKANASAFISQTLEENWSDVQKSDGYMKYIATRPRAERLGSHGLFGDTDGVELDKSCYSLMMPASMIPKLAFSGWSMPPTMKTTMHPTAWAKNI